MARRNGSGTSGSPMAEDNFSICGVPVGVAYQGSMEPEDANAPQREGADEAAESVSGMLTLEEARVLGCLIEKEMATPDYYPLTLNALMSACNQKSSRNPVVAFDTDTIEEALRGLRDKGLATLVHMAGARGAKNKHRISDRFPDLDRPQTALLAVLLLRGQQTAGELRTRTERLHRFDDIGNVEAAMEGLLGHVPDALARLLPPGGGRHVTTYVHLLCGEPGDANPTQPAAGQNLAPGPAGGESLAALRDEIAELKSRVADLEEEVGRLKGEP